MVRLIGRAAVFFAVVFVAALPAHAQAPEAPAESEDVKKRRAEAATLGNTAYGLMNNGMYVDAIDLFRKADERFHSARFTVFIARCQDKLGRPADALASMEKVANEQPGDDAAGTQGSIFRKAQDEARAAIPALMKRVPTISVDVDGGHQAAVTVDGASVSTGTVVRLNPGNHQVVATVAGESQTREVSLSEGQSEHVRFEFRVFEPGATGDDTSPSYVYPAVAFAVGGAGLLVGAIAGGVFIGRADDLKAQCPGDVCPPELEADVEETKTLGDVSTAGFVVGAVGVVTGTVLLIVTADDDGGEGTTVRLGPTGASVAVAF